MTLSVGKGEFLNVNVTANKRFLEVEYACELMHDELTLLIPSFPSPFQFRRRTRSLHKLPSSQHLGTLVATAFPNKRR